MAGEVQTASIGYTDGDNAMTIADGGAVAFAQDVTIANSSGLVVGGATQVNAQGITSELQVTGTGDVDASMIIARYSADAGQPRLQFVKSRNATIGSNTIVQDADNIGDIVWFGNDGNDNNNPSAIIRASIDGTPGSDDVPGRLVFMTTPDGAASPTEKMRILAGGGLTFNGDTAAANALDDYEEGTWTPLLGAHAVNGTHTYTQQIGTYTKVGNAVHLVGKVVIDTLNASGSAISGNIEMRGLPYTSATVNAIMIVGSFRPRFIDLDSSVGPTCTMGSARAVIDFGAAVDNASYDTIESDDLADGDEFWFTITYFV